METNMSTSVSSVTNHFPSAENGFATTTSSSTSSGATTVEVNSLAGYENGEVVVFVIEPNTPAAKQTFTGVVDISGSQLTSVVWTAGTNQTHAAGVTVVDYASATHISMISKGLAVEHNQDGSHALALFNKIYPVGSIYTNASNGTNPGTLLGFGTWVAFGAGKVPVGIDSGDTDFNTAEETGGAKTVTLTTTELPAHTHAVDPPNTVTDTQGAHTHTYNRWSAVIQNAVAATDAARYIVQGENPDNTGSSGSHAHNVNIASFTSGSAGSGGAHANVQPYIVVYMWKRTA
jgi:microcystin-dependent protein